MAYQIVVLILTSTIASASGEQSIGKLKLTYTLYGLIQVTNA